MSTLQINGASPTAKLHQVAKGDNFDSLLNELLLESMRAVGAIGAAITLWRDGQYDGTACVAQHGAIVPPDEWEAEPFFQEIPLVLGQDPDGFTSRLLSAPYTRESLDWARKFWPVCAEYHSRRGHAEVLNMACISKGALVASLGLAFGEASEADPRLLTTLTPLARQIALTIEMSRISEQAARAAVARDREAQARRINDFLVRSIAGLSSGSDLSAALESLLTELARAIGAAHLFLFRHEPKSRMLRLELPYLEGVTRWGPSPDEMPLWAGMFPDDITPAWRIMCDQRGLFTPEMTPIPASEFGWPGAFDYARRFQLSDIAHMVLFSGDTPVGSIGLGFRGGKHLNPADKIFIETVGQQAAIAIRMIDLGEEARRAAIAAERELAVELRVKELARANAAFSRSLMAVSESADFETTLEKVFYELVSAANATAGQLFLYDPAANTLATTVWIDETGHGRGFAPNSPPLLKQAFDADITPFFRLAISTRDLFGVNLRNMTPEQMPMVWPGTGEWHLANGRESACAIPILIGNRPIGVIGLAWPGQFSFSPEQRELLFGLTNQLAMVMELRSLAESQRSNTIAREREHAAQDRAAAIEREQKKAAEDRLAELSKTKDALKQTLDVVAFEPDHEKILGQVLAAITRQLKSPSSALWLMDRSSGRFKAHLIFQNDTVVEARNKAVAGTWGRGRDLFLKDHIRERRPIVYQVSQLQHSHPLAFDFFRRLGFESLLGVPLILGTETVGSLTIRFRTVRELTPEELELTQAMAHQATMAIQLTLLAERAGKAALSEERARFARDIHDTLAQGFTGILMQLGAASQVPGDKRSDIEPHLKAIAAAARSSLAEARRSVRTLRLIPAPQCRLDQTIEELIESARLQTKAEVSSHIKGTRGQLLPHVENELCRIVQESLNNALKHADAKKISVSVEFQPEGSVRLSVKDDGAGFDPSVNPREDSFGIIGMQERAASIGASLTVISEPGRGAAIVVQYGKAGVA